MRTNVLSSARRAALLSAAAPRSLAGAVQNDAGAIAETIAQMKSAIEANIKANETKWGELQNANKALQDELKASTKDVVVQAKLDKISADIDARIAEIKANALGVKELDKKIESALADLDRVNSKLSAALLGGGGGGTDPRNSTPEMNSYRKAFNAMFRHGEDHKDAGGKFNLMDLEVKAALTKTSNPDGGFTVTPEVDSAIDEVLKEVSTMRQLATIRPIGSDEYKKLVNQHGTASGWVGETQARPQTLAPNLSELKFPVFELYAMPAATQQLLDDSTIDIAEWLATEVELEFAYQEGNAFVNGNGVNKPRGFLGYDNVVDSSYAWGKVGYFGTGVNGAFAADPNGDKALIDVYTGLKTAYRRNASWAMNRKTIGAIRKMKDSNGQPLIMMSLMRDGMIEELLGRPVTEMPDMPDLATNSMSIAFADWRRAYTIVDRQGTRVLRDPYTLKPYVLFYTTKRVGGGISNFEAIKLLRFA